MLFILCNYDHNVSCMQYQNILELLTSFDQISLTFKYQKYRPNSMNKKTRFVGHKKLSLP